MKNRIVVFANQKGGVGKSTLCMLFADYLAWKSKMSVLSIPTCRNLSRCSVRRIESSLNRKTHTLYRTLMLLIRKQCSNLWILHAKQKGMSFSIRLVIFQRMDLFLCLLLLILSFVHTSMKKRRSTLQECLYRLSTLCNKELLICMRNFSLYPIV